MSDEDSVADSTCTACTGTSTATCAAGTCAAGYHTYDAGTGTCTVCATSAAGCGTFDENAACVDAASTGTYDDQACTAADAGYFLAAGIATACSDMYDEDSVADSTCTACTGTSSATCTAGTCAAGYHTYDAGTGTCTVC